MKKLLLLLLLTFGFIGSSYADAICRDGTRSFSSGSGTCSWHGGVYKWLDNKEPYYAPKPETVPKKKSYVPSCSKVPANKRKKCLEKEKEMSNLPKDYYLKKEFGDDVISIKDLPKNFYSDNPRFNFNSWLQP
jgi:hypothetical protein